MPCDREKRFRFTRQLCSSVVVNQQRLSIISLRSRWNIFSCCLLPSSEFCLRKFFTAVDFFLIKHTNYFSFVQKNSLCCATKNRDGTNSCDFYNFWLNNQFFCICEITSRWVQVLRKLISVSIADNCSNVSNKTTLMRKLKQNQIRSSARLKIGCERSRAFIASLQIREILIRNFNIK